MTVTVAILTVVVAVLVVMIVAQAALHQRERNAFALERRVMMDRIVAKHAGEVIALDRTSGTQREPRDDRTMILTEGLT